jgi:hypothetical protein
MCSDPSVGRLGLLQGGLLLFDLDQPAPNNLHDDAGTQVSTVNSEAGGRLQWAD